MGRETEDEEGTATETLAASLRAAEALVMYKSVAIKIKSSVKTGKTTADVKTVDMPHDSMLVRRAKVVDLRLTRRSISSAKIGR